MNVIGWAYFNYIAVYFLMTDQTKLTISGQSDQF